LVKKKKKAGTSLNSIVLHMHPKQAHHFNNTWHFFASYTSAAKRAVCRDPLQQGLQAWGWGHYGNCPVCRHAA